MTKKYIWLSHELSPDTPAYGGGTAFKIEDDKNINCGDSCNTVSLKLSNNIGSHVDAPKHFINDGMSIEQYSPNDWIFTQPLLLDVKFDSDNIVLVEHIEAAIPNSQVDADFVLLRTGAELYRDKERFWKSPPGFSPEIYSYLQNRFPSFSAIGMDTISSFAHRELGREAHRVFLGAGIRVFEDLKLKDIKSSSKLHSITALPLRFFSGDGAPITIIGQLSE